MSSWLLEEWLTRHHYLPYIPIEHEEDHSEHTQHNNRDQEFAVIDDRELLLDHIDMDALPNRSIPAPQIHTNSSQHSRYRSRRAHPPLRSPWTCLSSIPFGCFSVPIKINELEFIMAPHYADNPPVKGLYKYNTMRNDWSLFMVDSTPLIVKATFGIHSNRKLLYIQSNKKLMKANLKTRRLTEIVDIDINFGSNPSGLMIDDEFHIVSGAQNNSHFKWNDKKKRFNQLGYNHEWNKQECNAILYVSSQRRLLSLGGFPNSDAVCTTSTDYIAWQRVYPSLPTAIAHTAIILTIDERYIIIFGDGFVRCSDRIFVVDVNSWAVYESAIRMPFKNGCHGLSMANRERDDRIVRGYIRSQILCEEQHHNLIPNDIMNMLTSWYYWSNDVHIFEFRTGLHWKIAICDILSSCRPFKQKYLTH